MSPVPWTLGLLGIVPQSMALEGAPELERLEVVPTAAKGAEVIGLQAGTRRAAVTLSRSRCVELFDLADPARPRSLRVLDPGLAEGEELTSIALPPEGDWCLLTVKAEGARTPGRLLACSLADGARLAVFPCGVGPDSVVLSPDGTLALVANEAEGFERLEADLVSAPGSLTLVRLAPDLPASEVLQIPFETPLVGSAAGRWIERRVDGKSVRIPLGDGPEFLEPEGIAFLDGGHALVTLQENDAVARVDLAAGRVERIFLLGTTTHPADLDDDSRFDERGSLTARREPDGIAVSPDGRCFLTADEGATEAEGEDAPSGGRTLSVFDVATGALLGDTGPGLDRIAAIADLYPDRRSPRKGSEPEMVLTLELDGVPYAAVTLERAGAIALVDLRDPKRPAVVSICKTGLKHYEDAPEGLVHFRDPETGADYLYAANEGTGTLGVLRVRR